MFGLWRRRKKPAPEVQKARDERDQLSANLDRAIVEADRVSDVDLKRVVDDYRRAERLRRNANR